MPEASVPVTYWHVLTGADMIDVIDTLVDHGYTGTVTAAMHTPIDGEPVKRWALSLVGGGQTVTVEAGQVVVWTGFAVQTVPWNDFQDRIA